MAAERFNNAGQPPLGGGGPDTERSALRDVTNETDDTTEAAQAQSDAVATFVVRAAIQRNDFETAENEVQQIQDDATRQTLRNQINQAKNGAAAAATGRDGMTVVGAKDMDQLFFMMAVYLETFSVDFKWDTILKEAERDANLSTFNEIRPVAVSTPARQGSGGGSLDARQQAEADVARERAAAEDDVDAAMQEGRDRNVEAQDSTFTANAGKIDGTVVQKWPVQNLPLIESGFTKSVEFASGEGIIGFAEPVLTMNKGGSHIEMDLTLTYAVGVGDIPNLSESQQEFEKNERRQASERQGGREPNLTKFNGDGDSGVTDREGSGETNFNTLNYDDSNEIPSQSQVQTRTDPADPASQEGAPQEGLDSGADGAAEGGQTFNGNVAPSAIRADPTEGQMAAFTDASNINAQGSRPQIPAQKGDKDPKIAQGNVADHSVVGQGQSSGEYPGGQNKAGSDVWTVEEIMAVIYGAMSLVYPWAAVSLGGSKGEANDSQIKESKRGAGQFPVIFLRHYSLFPFLTPFVCKQVTVTPDENQPLIITEPQNLGSQNSHLTVPAVRQQVTITLSLMSAHNYLPFFKDDVSGRESIAAQTAGSTFLKLAKGLAPTRFTGRTPQGGS